MKNAIPTNSTLKPLNRRLLTVIPWLMWPNGWSFHYSPQPLHLTIGDAVSVIPTFMFDEYGLYGDLVVAPARAVINNPQGVSWQTALLGAYTGARANEICQPMLMMFKTCEMEGSRDQADKTCRPALSVEVISS